MEKKAKLCFQMLVNMLEMCSKGVLRRGTGKQGGRGCPVQTTQTTSVVVDYPAGSRVTGSSTWVTGLVFGFGLIHAPVQLVSTLDSASNREIVYLTWHFIASYSSRMNKIHVHVLPNIDLYTLFIG